MNNLILEFKFEWAEIDHEKNYEQLKRINHISIQTREGIIIFGGENSSGK
jgi:hypothetical protein